MSLGIIEAQLAGLFAESALWGVLVLTSWQCLCSILVVSPYQGTYTGSVTRLAWKDRSDIHWGFLIITALFFLIGTLDVALGLRRDIVAFVSGQPIEVFNQLTDPVSIVKQVDFAAVALIADVVLIYRCYIVFGRSWKVIVIPIALDVGALVCGIVIFIKISTLDRSSLIFVPEVITWTAVAAGCTLVVNIMTTLLIVWRIWSVDRRRAQLSAQHTDSSRGSSTLAASTTSGSPLRRVIKIFVESAALYCITFIVTIVTYATGHNSSYVVSDMGIQITGICFDLIIIRISSGRAFSGNSQASSASTQQRRLSTLRFRAFRKSRRNDTENPPIPLTMLSQQSTDDNEDGDVLRRIRPSVVSATIPERLNVSIPKPELLSAGVVEEDVGEEEWKRTDIAGAV